MLQETINKWSERYSQLYLKYYSDKSLTRNQIKFLTKEIIQIQEFIDDLKKLKCLFE